MSQVAPPSFACSSGTNVPSPSSHISFGDAKQTEKIPTSPQCLQSPTVQDVSPRVPESLTEEIQMLREVLARINAELDMEKANHLATRNERNALSYEKTKMEKDMSEKLEYSKSETKFLREINAMTERIAQDRTAQVETLQKKNAELWIMQTDIRRRTGSVNESTEENRRKIMAYKPHFIQQIAQPHFPISASLDRVDSFKEIAVKKGSSSPTQKPTIMVVSNASTSPNILEVQARRVIAENLGIPAETGVERESSIAKTSVMPGSFEVMTRSPSMAESSTNLSQNTQSQQSVMPSTISATGIKRKLPEETAPQQNPKSKPLSTEENVSTNSRDYTVSSTAKISQRWYLGRKPGNGWMPRDSLRDYKRPWEGG